MGKPLIGLREQDGCLLLIQTVEGRNDSIRFLCLKVGGGRCNPDEKGTWCDRWESKEYHHIGRVPDIDLANSYSSLKDYVVRHTSPKARKSGSPPQRKCDR